VPAQRLYRFGSSVWVMIPRNGWPSRNRVRAALLAAALASSLVAATAVGALEGPTDERADRGAVAAPVGDGAPNPRVGGAAPVRRTQGIEDPDRSAGVVAQQTTPPLVGRMGADAALRSGGVFFLGQTLGVEIPDSVSDAETFVLRAYDRGDDRAGSFVREFGLDADDRRELSTDRLRGDYVVTVGDDRSRIVRFGSDGVATGTAGPADARPFEVAEQSLRVEWGRERITTGDDDVDLDIRSNRARYNLNVSSESLDFEELEALFRAGGASGNPDPYADRQPFAAGGTVFDAHEDENVLVLRGLRDGSLSADFTDIDAGTYAFSFEVTDTGVTSDAPVGDGETTPEADPDPAFFEVRDLDPTAATVAPGASVTVSARVTNVGGTEASQPVELLLDGESVTRESVRLAPDESRTVSLEFDAPDTPGGYTHSVATANATRSGALTVEAAATPEPTDAPGTDPGPETGGDPGGGPTDEPTPEPVDQPGFGVPATLGALAAAALLAGRRRQR